MEDINRSHLVLMLLVKAIANALPSGIRSEAHAATLRLLHDPEMKPTLERIDGLELEVRRMADLHFG